jgi:hypothetical protein
MSEYMMLHRFECSLNVYKLRMCVQMMVKEERTYNRTGIVT